MFSIQRYSYTTEALRKAQETFCGIDLDIEEPVEMGFKAYLHMRKSLKLADKLLKDITHGGESKLEGIKPQHEAKAKAAIPAGARWITIHPGDREKGVPVLIQDDGDGHAHVIAGAGGKLNMLKLNNIKSKDEYAQAVKDKREKEKATIAEKRAQEKESLASMSKEEQDKVHEGKKAAKDAEKAKAKEVKSKREEARKKLAETFRQTLGWDEEDIDGAYQEALDQAKQDLVNANDTEDPEQIKAAKKSLKRVEQGYKRAKKSQEQHAASTAKEMMRDFQRRLLLDPELRAQVEQNLETESGAGELIRKENKSKSKGFKSDYKESAKESGLTQEELKEEKKEVFDKRINELMKTAPATAEFIVKGVTANREINEVKRDFYGEKEELPKVADLDQKTELLKTYLEYKKTLAEADEEEGVKTINQINLDGTTEEVAERVDRIQYGNGTKLNYSELLGESLENEADRMLFERQAETNKSLLDAIEKNPGGVEKWIANGNYNGLNSIALQALKTEGIDRDVVDILGIGNAAKLQAMMMHRGLTPEEYSVVSEAMEDYHATVSEGIVKEAIERGNELIARAESIQLDIANNPEDLAIQSELNETRLQYLDEANRIMGQALGSMEASAAMVIELQNTKEPDQIEANMGGISSEDTIVRLRALGLQKGDYEIDTVNGDKVVTIKGEALEKLLKPVSAEDIAIENQVAAIKAGELDEAGWLPDGIVYREADSFKDPGPGQAPAGDIHAQSLGDNAEEIKQTEEAVHRTLGSMPEGRLAMEDIDNLSSKDQTDLRRYWEQNIYKGSMASKTATKEFTEKGASKQSTWNSFTKEHGGDEAKAFEAIKANLMSEEFSPPDMFGIPDPHPLARVDLDNQATYRNIPGVADMKNQIDNLKADIEAGRTVSEIYDSTGKLVKVEPEKELAKLEAEYPEKAKELYGQAMRDHYLNHMSGVTNFKEGGERDEKSAWGEYVRMHGDVKRAQEAVLDRIKGDFMNRFVKNYRGVTKKPLKTEVQKIRNHRDHVFAMLDKESRDNILNKVQAELSSAGATVANRQGGKFASGSWKEKALQYMDEKAKTDASQGDLFGGEDIKQNDGTEYLSIGKRAEEQLKSIIPQMAANQRRGQKFNIYSEVSMSKGDHLVKQRAIKMFEATKRMNVTFGPGKGKTITSIGAFTHLKGQGKVKRGIFAVPSVVQAQFGNEGNTFLEPGKYKWSSNPGMSQEDRIKALKDGNLDMVVATHQSIRDDMIHVMSKHNGMEEEAFKEKFNGASREDRKKMLSEALKAEGIDFDMLTVDESHYTVNRKGKEDATLSNVMDALNQHTPYFMNQSGTPIKNDISEAFDFLRKVAPDKFKDQDEFIKKYGVDSSFSKKALQRLINRYSYASPTVTGVKRTMNKEDIKLHPDQQAEYDKVQTMFKRASMATAESKVDIEAMKFLSPNSFKGRPEDKHEEIARNLQKSAGTIKEEALNRVVNQFDWKRNAKIDRLTEIMNGHRYEADHPKNAAKKGDNKPGVVFAHNIQSVENVRQAMEAKGLRVGVIQGSMSGAEKDAVKNGFNPVNPADRKYDVVVLSDAGATGISLQNAGYLVNYDLPQTSWVKQQREGRIDRHGQAHDEIHYHDLVSDTDHEKTKWDRIERKKALGGVFEEDPGALDDTGLLGHIQAVRQEKYNQGVAA